MPLKNSHDRYGWISITLHWGMTAAVIGMFALGLWMRELSYYDPWYQRGPFIHKSIGILLLGLVLLRLLWKSVNITPRDAPTLKPWERRSAKLTHALMYLLLLALMTAGYLISTADGRPVSVFDWFSVPATVQGLPDQEDVAGEVHEVLAWALIVLAGLHAAAALKHHFIDRDNTLMKMLGRSHRGKRTITQLKE